MNYATASHATAFDLCPLPPRWPCPICGPLAFRHGDVCQECRDTTRILPTGCYDPILFALYDSLTRDENDLRMLYDRYWVLTDGHNITNLRGRNAIHRHDIYVQHVVAKIGTTYHNSRLKAQLIDRATWVFRLGPYSRSPNGCASWIASLVRSALHSIYALHGFTLRTSVTSAARRRANDQRALYNHHLNEGIRVQNLSLSSS